MTVMSTVFSPTTMVVFLLLCTFCLLFPTLANKEDIEEMFQLALHAHSVGVKNMTAQMLTKSLTKVEPLSQLQLIRIPKASSTSLSVVARRLVNCDPPGPCCKYPGDPAGSCPRRELFLCQLSFKVLGCTGHMVDYHSLLSPSVTSIAIIREPKARALSAYFYPGHHHNSDCKKGLIVCFEEYLVDNRFKNIATKMFSGEYAYAPAKTCASKNECKFNVETALETVNKHLFFLGVSEMWELSLVLLHKKFLFFKPEKSEFALSEGTADSEKLVSSLVSDTYNNNNHHQNSQNSQNSHSRSLAVQNSINYNHKNNNVNLKNKINNNNNRVNSNSNNNNKGSVKVNMNSNAYIHNNKLRTNTPHTNNDNHGNIHNSNSNANGNSNNNNSTAFTVRINKDSTYLDFKNVALTRYAEGLSKQNQWDVTVYAAALTRLCEELHVFHLWHLKKVQKYWRSRLPAGYSVEACR